MEAMQLKKL